MSKVLRLHKKGKETIEHWGDSEKYIHSIINEIDDPGGESAKKEITSIPSPFARFELVRNAFSIVNDKDLDGKTIYHKMIAEAFDIGQILFEYEKFKDKIDIISWNWESDLKALSESEVNGHKVLAKTMRTFLEQDSKYFNFGELNRLFLIDYKHGDKLHHNIIGGTSPITLFFTPANDLSVYKDEFNFGQHSAFDEQYMPLYKRDPRFIKYIFAFRNGIEDFAGKFKQLSDYLNSTFSKLNPELREEINNLEVNSIDDYLNIELSGPGDYVEVLGYQLKHQKQDLNNIEEKSDFVIRTQRKVSGKKPLVLPNTITLTELFYVTDNWDKNNKADSRDGLELNQRVLPFDGSRYPYLTRDDFLEDTIIKIPKKINSNSFFDPYSQLIDNESYLMPIKPLFFDYFDIKDLTGLIGNKPMFELEKGKTVENITATLRIPIKANGQYIEYKKTYIRLSENDESDFGRIIDFDFVMALFPNIKFSKPVEAFYRLGFMPFEENNAEVLFYNANENVDINEIVNRDDVIRTHVLNGRLFDHIRIKLPQGSGIIAPIFESKEGNKEFKFSIDLGTTNTHIEYIDKNNPKNYSAFDITENDEQIVYYHSEDSVVADIYKYPFINDFIPEHIGKNYLDNFPIRTVLYEARNTDHNREIHPFAHTNIGFWFDNIRNYEYNDSITNLKWSDDQYNKTHVESYIDSLMLLIRNKVLLNGGDLRKTEIIWFYPVSMSYHRYKLFESTWKESFEKYISTNTNNLTSMTESEAPHRFYRKVKESLNDNICIDIGGETTDISISQGKDIKYISSARLGGNAIINEYITKLYVASIKDILKANDLNDLYDILVDLSSNNKYKDIPPFLFSLKANKDVIEKEASNRLDFIKMLRDRNELKIIFIFYYTAIIYYTAKLVESTEMNYPRHISFSGMGSSILEAIFPNPEDISTLTSHILQAVLGAKGSGKVEILYKVLHNDKHMLKEITSLGGLMSSDEPSIIGEKLNEIKVILNGADMKGFYKNTKYADINNKEHIENVKSQVVEFANLFFNLNKDYSFTEHFGITINEINLLKDIIFDDEVVRNLIIRSIEDRINEIGGEEELVEESLFFAAFPGLITMISREIYNDFY